MKKSRMAEFLLSKYVIHC